MILLNQITQVHTSVQTYKRIKKNFQLPVWADGECFLGLEGRKGASLELLAPDNVTRNLFAKVLNALLANHCREPETNFLFTQYGHDVNNIRRVA